MRTRTLISFVLAFSLLAMPLTAFGKKGEKNFKKGLELENAQQWDKAAQEFTLAVAADPANMEYQLHFRRASFNASQTYMQQGRSLAEQGDFVGAYNAFRQAYGFDPVNELAVAEMERMLRMQGVKEGKTTPAKTSDPQDTTFTAPSAGQELGLAPSSSQMRVVQYQGDLKSFIRLYAEHLNLNVIFDRQSFAQSRPLDINLRDVTTAQALDYVFLQEGLFFQKLSRRTILVADQSRRPQYQQLVLRTFFLSNMKPTDARTLVQQAIPPSVGRPQTIVVPDDATNSLTVRDTAENVRLIGDLLQSIDKDRAEVVMDVNIYEVSKNDLLQFGNQVGQSANGGAFSIGGFPGLSVLSAAGTTAANQGPGVNLAALVGGVPTALAAALVIPNSTLTAFQNKDNTKLIASTQVHAFNGEESTARIGQRVPVQTAQAYPFSNVQPNQTGSGLNGNPFGSGGFPVINYEPTGLTLKFTPQVFPNLDVQVKMNIESKDVQGAGGLTPTFTERTITGTARVQNNRTMMLASVSQDVETHGRAGLPVLGGFPVLGRLFTSPTRNNRQIDIVISVTPRVLRAPTVTPRDEEMRPSGTLQSPTTGSLAQMVFEADRDDQIAAARAIPRDVAMQLPDRALETPEQSSAVPTVNKQVARVDSKATDPVEELPSFVPAPKSLVSAQAASDVATVNASAAGTQNAVFTSLPKAVETSLNTKSGARVAQLSFLNADEALKVGEKRRYAIQLSSDVSLSVAMLALRFDPKVLKVNAVSAGSLLNSQSEGLGATFSQSVDPTGVCLISISALNSKSAIKGTGELIYIDIEAIGAGDAALIFDKETLHLVASDARDIVTQVKQGSATVKQ